MICRLTGEGDYRHSLDSCRNGRKYEYFQAKKQATGQGYSLKRKGWFENYTGCYGCLLPQEVCPQQGQKVGGRWICEFRDMVGPICWAQYQNRVWRDGVLTEQLEGKRFRSEIDYLMWLGEFKMVFGIQASRGFEITAIILEAEIGISLI